MTETQLVTELKKGNEKAFRFLIKQYKGKVFNTCYGFIHNKFDADDIAQEVFIEIYNSINNFKAESTLSTWIYRITVNKSLDALRKQKRRNRFNLYDNSDKEIKSIADSNTLNPDEIFESNERISILNSAIDKLPDTQKTTFVLHKYEQLSYKEIAAITGNTLSSVESLMHRAKENLKKHLYKYYRNSL